jgi:hypothetical protein
MFFCRVHKGGSSRLAPIILFKVEFISNYSSSRHWNTHNIAPLPQAVVVLAVDGFIFPECVWPAAGFGFRKYSFIMLIVPHFAGAAGGVGGGV